jgi:hypothetical protein
MSDWLSPCLDSSKRKRFGFDSSSAVALESDVFERNAKTSGVGANNASRGEKFLAMPTDRICDAL